MNFRFDLPKATQVAGEFLRLAGGSLDVLKLVKLAYLLDRASLIRRGLPVLGGDYYSMRNGPVTSELLDLINSGRLRGAQTDWSDFISARAGNLVALQQPCPTGRLSESELLLIAEVFTQHAGSSGWELADWCHEHCAEWHPLTRGRHEISVESILEAGGRSEASIARVLRDEAESRHLAELLN